MVLVAILLAVLAVGLLMGLAGARLWALLAGAWLAALALALVLPRAVSLRLLGWDWRVMLIATGLGLLVALYVWMIRRVRRLSGIGRLRAEAEAARAEGAALQAGIEAARAQARAEAARGQLAAAQARQAAEVPAFAAPSVAQAGADADPASAAAGEEGAAPPVLVCGPHEVTAPLCLALAAAGAARITLSGEGAAAVAAAIASLHPACRITPAAMPPPVAGCALVLAAGGDVAALNRDCVAAGVPLLHGWLDGGEAHVALWHPAAGAPCLACLRPGLPEDGVASAAPGLAALLGALMAAQLRGLPAAAAVDASLAGRALAWDGCAAGLRGQILRPDPGCEICGPRRHAAGIAEQKPGSRH